MLSSPYQFRSRVERTVQVLILVIQVLLAGNLGAVAPCEIMWTHRRGADNEFYPKLAFLNIFPINETFLL